MDVTVIQAHRDYEDYVAVRNAVTPRHPQSAEEARFFASLEPDHLRLLARVDGVPVGCGFGGTLIVAPDEPHGEIWIGVAPDARRRGVGSALLARFEEHLQSLGKSAADTTVEGDEPESLAFAERRGYREIGREQTVALDLDAWQPEGVSPEGIVIADLAERPDLLRAVYEIDSETSPDIPGSEDYVAPPFEWFEQLTEKPGYDPALVVVALAGDEAVGCAMLAPLHANPELATHWMTGVRRAWRGRGIAGALKDGQLARAKARGVRLAITNNELRNAPIRRLNERLGYRPQPDRIKLRGPV